MNIQITTASKHAWRKDLVSYAVMYEYENFYRLCEDVIPEEWKSHTLPRLPIIYQDIMTELENDLKEKSNDDSSEDHF